MGQVYRAKDTRLKRDVALKILPDGFASDPDRVARFQREAELLATLNHSNIAAIYGLEQAGGMRALVLELVEGPTLADRIERGPIPLDEALPIALQIAAALEAAHDHGIIHRDLKPANIKLRPDAAVKVLDFGLAKPLEQAGLPSDRMQSLTVLSPAPTLAGIILGTAAYMSPEQARGKTVDKRADIWAFGCVLYEMLTGQKPFAGETLTDTLAAVVKNQPDWRALPSGTPAAVQSVIARCLRKDPEQRLHDIADGRLELEEVLNDPVGAAPVIVPPRLYRERALWIAALVFLGGALFFAGLFSAARRSNVPSSGDPIAFSVFPPERTAFSAAVNFTLSVPSFALSPDGHALVFSAEAPGTRPMLWVRSLDQVSARRLDGTEGAESPLWSPDSRWVGFFADGKLKKVPATGGAVQVITQTISDVRGATWGPEDVILFASGTAPILSVNSAGGTTSPVTVVDVSRREAAHRYPHFLPDGQHFLYSIVGGRADIGGVYAGSLDGKTKKLLVAGNTSAVYAYPGHLLFVDGDTLMGQAFDADRLELKGQPFLVSEHVGRNTGSMSAVSASRIGTIAFAGTISQNGRLAWTDRAGNAIGSPGVPEGEYTDFRLSPDETRLAASLFDQKAGAIEIWLKDLARGSTSRVTAGGSVTASPLWSPDGERLVFRNNRNGFVEFFQRSAAGSGSERPLLSLEALQAAQITAQIPSFSLIPTDWSPDGRSIAFSALAPGGSDLWLLPVEEGGKPSKFIASPADEMHGNFSPDGRLMAYTSNESSRFEVYIETIPRSDRRWPLSTGGGYEPRWRADGREIYYLSEDRKLMAVQVGPGPSFGIPKPLFQTNVRAGVNALRTHYAPSRDGQRFLVNVATDAVVSPITVVLQWTAMLNK